MSFLEFGEWTGVCECRHPGSPERGCPQKSAGCFVRSPLFHFRNKMMANLILKCKAQTNSPPLPLTSFQGWWWSMMAASMCFFPFMDYSSGSLGELSGLCVTLIWVGTLSIPASELEKLRAQRWKEMLCCDELWETLFRGNLETTKRLTYIYQSVMESWTCIASYWAENTIRGIFYLHINYLNFCDLELGCWDSSSYVLLS